MATHGLPTWPWAEAGIDHLPPAEALLLEAMRHWDGAVRAGLPPLPAARLPLASAEAADAAAPLDAVLRSLPGLRFAALPDPRLRGEEPALLLALELAQRGSRREALAGFLRLRPAGDARDALGHAVTLGSRLRRAGLLLAHPLRG